MTLVEARPLTLVFAFQHRFFLTDDGRVWSPGMFPTSIWSRYLKHFDRVIVLGRLQGSGVNPPPGWVVSDCPSVEFQFLPDLALSVSVLKRCRLYAAQLLHVIRRGDAVIVRTSPSGCLAALVAQFVVERPWAFEVVGCAWDAAWNHGRRRVKWSAPLYFMLTRFVISRSRYSLYVTERFLQRRYPSSSAAFQVAASDVELDPSMRYGGLVVRREPTPAGQFTFGLIGSLASRYKGIQTVLAALSTVVRDHPSIEFRILGSGPQEHWRREVACFGLESIVHFDGVRPPGTPVLEWLRGVDVYLQPSFQEGLPRALIEAMSIGLPAIGSTCGGIPELLEQECLIRPGDSRKLASLMCMAIDDPDWRSRQGERNRTVARRYEKPILAAKREAFYARFAGDTRSLRGRATL